MKIITADEVVKGKFYTDKRMTRPYKMEFRMDGELMVRNLLTNGLERMDKNVIVYIK